MSFKIVPAVKYLVSYNDDINRININKPVATQITRTGKSIFNENYESYDHDEKLLFNNKLLLLNNIKIFKSRLEPSQFIFYSHEYLERLCLIFDYFINDALEILSTWNKKTTYEKYFILCAFHNDYDINNIFQLNNEKKIDIKLYDMYLS